MSRLKKKFTCERLTLAELLKSAILLAWVTVCAATTQTHADEQQTETAEAKRPVNAEQERFFEMHVRPLLSEKCYRCHGPAKQNGKLRLDSIASILKGGESGPALVPGKPDESLLIEAINYASLEMPPTNKLTDEEIAALTAWVKEGAIWPDSISSRHATGFASTITDEDRAYWAFQPLAHVDPPEVDAPAWCRNEIDRFILNRLEQENFSPAPPADRATLIRRLSFDLIGVPPTPEEVADFLADTRDDAYDRLVDRLLDDRRYGEKWAQHWLDLVRYAESDGYKQDAYRPEAWRYRDFVIRSFNDDKPYDRFVQEQIAGDELFPSDLDALAATGFLRHWIYEYNQRDVRTQWDTILNDITDVAGDVFLGMSMSCARCHNHKFDPILQRDYFRLKAFFAPLLPRDDLLFGPPEEVDAYRQKHSEWMTQTAEIRRRMEEIERPFREQATDAAIDKFPPDIRPMLRTDPAQREPLDHQLASLAYRQVVEELERLDVEKKLEGDAQTEYRELKKQLAEYDHLKPAPLPHALTVGDAGQLAPATVIPGDDDRRDILPGFLTVLDPLDAVITDEYPNSTGRRAALARWLTNPENPLTTRVIVNRIWQYHFGKGLAATPSNFGRLGDPPSHPELLDWLTRRFLDGGWRFKSVHRLIVTSTVYRQSSLVEASPVALQRDPGNRWLWRRNVRRLDAEQIRDAMLSVSGEIDARHGGPSVDGDEPRRAIYTKVLRNSRDPLLDVFDAPDHFNSISQRNVTTTPTQSLLMINGEWTLKRARALAARLAAMSLDEPGRIDYAYRLLFGRAATDAELSAALAFLAEQEQQIASELAEQVDATAKDGEQADESAESPDPHRLAWIDFCHILLNSNEFLYVD